MPSRGGREGSEAGGAGRVKGRRGNGTSQVVKQRSPGHLLVLDLDHILVGRVPGQKREWDRGTACGPGEWLWPVPGREAAGLDVTGMRGMKRTAWVTDVSLGDSSA